MTTQQKLEAILRGNDTAAIRLLVETIDVAYERKPAKSKIIEFPSPAAVDRRKEVTTPA